MTGGLPVVLLHGWPVTDLHWRHLAPRLRAAFNTAVQRFALGLRPGQAPNVDQLSRDLQAAANSVMGRPGATVLLGTVMAV